MPSHEIIDTMVIEVPIATPESYVPEIVRANFAAVGLTCKVFDTFRIPSRVNTMDAYRIVMYTA
jgi:hypothetical protein